MQPQRGPYSVSALMATLSSSRLGLYRFPRINAVHTSLTMIADAQRVWRSFGRPSKTL